MKVSYYPGCSLEETAVAYDWSTRQVCQNLDIELAEIPEWSCCGSSPGLKMDHLLSTSLGSYNLALAQKQELPEVVIPCPFCFRRLKSAQDQVQQDDAVKQQVQEAIALDPNNDMTVSSLLGFMRHTVGLEAIEAKVKKPLKGLKVLPYYGCYLVKPSKVTQFDNPEHPVSMDEVLTALGAEVMDWDFKTECCGASLAVAKADNVRDLSGRILREATHMGADALVVACQLCQANLDLRQDEIGRRHRKKYAMPILYFTQLMGLAFGLPYQELGMSRHVVSPKNMLKSKGVIE